MKKSLSSLVFGFTFVFAGAMVATPAFANAKDTCGTPSSIKGCKTGDCYDGDKLGANGLWVADKSCQMVAVGVAGGSKDVAQKKEGATRPATAASAASAR